ncbi:MAG: hypothetical protein NT165_02025 [Candidatus Falkowbacteria bacterium]|nr:hypothetical protein [Candidatus Falkowbacteria bacterium]
MKNIFENIFSKKTEAIPQKENEIENPQIRKGADFVFEQNPELAKIGTIEQYSQYLDTIFPDSKIKDIVYHGTSVDSYNSILKEGFDLNKSGDNLGYMGKIASFFTEKAWTNNFEKGAVVSALVNITSEYIDNSGNLTEEGINEFKKRLIDLKIIPFINSLEDLNNDIVSVNDSDRNTGFRTARDTIKLKNYLFSSIENPEDTYNSILIALSISGLKRNDNVVDMLSKDEIHVLNSPEDIENFKKFIATDHET